MDKGQHKQLLQEVLQNVRDFAQYLIQMADAAEFTSTTEDYENKCRLPNGCFLAVRQPLGQKKNQANVLTFGSEGSETEARDILSWKPNNYELKEYASRIVRRFVIFRLLEKW